MFIFGFMISCAHAIAPTKSGPKVESKNYSDELLTGCEKLTYAEWVKRYDGLENKVVEDLRKNPKISQSAEQKEFLEIVYPQDLPKTHAMKGAFVGCVEAFQEYQSAGNGVASQEALKRLESCYEDAYKIDPPKVLGQYLDCLKKVKY